MSRGARISEQKKRILAADLVSGRSLEEVAASHGITTGAISRLRREDEGFQAMEAELAETLVGELQRRLRGLAGTAVDTLHEICTIDQAVQPSGVGKILEQRRYAALNILTWGGNLKVLGKEQPDEVEARLERLILEKQLRLLEEPDRRRETPGQPYGPPSPPLYLFRKPDEPDEPE